MLPSLSQLKQDLRELLEANSDWQKLHLKHPPENEMQMAFYEVHKETIENEIDYVKKLIKRMSYKGEGNGADIAKAKAYPIEDLIKVRGGFALCPFHNERHPSFKIYADNRGHCFGACGKSFSSIDIVMKQDGISFVEAVRKLCQ